MDKNKEPVIQPIICSNCGVAKIEVIGIIGLKILLKCGYCGSLLYLDDHIFETKKVRSTKSPDYTK